MNDSVTWLTVKSKSKKLGESMALCTQLIICEQSVFYDISSLQEKNSKNFVLSFSFTKSVNEINL